MNTGLSDKVALVTGGASGIGRASCLKYGTEAAKVVVADTKAEGGEATVSLLREAGGRKSPSTARDPPGNSGRRRA